MSDTRPRRRQASPKAPRAQLSQEAIIATAIAVLDSEGAEGLTFRKLAHELRAGVGSLYWHVKNRDELLQLATDSIIGDILPVIDEHAEGDPISSIRSIAIALFTALEEHPWAAAHFLHNTDLQRNSIDFWEGLGEQTLRLNLTAFQRFQAVSIVVNYVIGMGAQMAIQEPPPPIGEENGNETRERFLHQWAASWMERDPEQYPFAQEVAPIFADHDDFVQFTSGLDLILLGLERQAGIS